MARFAMKGLEEYALRLSQLGEAAEATAKRAVYGAAKIVTDEVRRNIQNLPEEEYRYLKQGETFKGVPREQKRDLLDSLGVTKIEYDRRGYWQTKIGFDGYGRYKTKKYPRGLPNQLLARAIESGSIVRKKTPFVRPAVRKTKSAAMAAMQQAIDEDFQKRMEEK